MPQISVIVPIYNGEKYLCRCIDSILLQTWEDFELILVNDGSNDGSLAICDEFAAKDVRIKVIDQANAGVSMARNRGIDIAKGDYICFIDCDDWVDSCYLQLLYDNLKESCAGLSMTGYREVTEAGELGRDTETIGYVSVLDSDLAMFHLFEAVDFMSFCYPWGKLFKADIIRSHNIQFNPSIAIGEDRLFIFDYLHHVGKVSCISKSTYNYLQNGNGAMAVLRRDKIDVKYLTCFDAMDIMLQHEMPDFVRKRLYTDYVAILLRFRKYDHLNDSINSIFKRKLNKIADNLIFSFGLIPLRQWIKLVLVYKMSYYYVA